MEIGYGQVMVPLLYAKQVLDYDYNGLISVQEASEDPDFSSLFGNLTMVLAQNVTAVNRIGEKSISKYDMNNDNLISINDELKPRQLDNSILLRQ